MLGTKGKGLKKFVWTALVCVQSVNLLAQEDLLHLDLEDLSQITIKSTSSTLIETKKEYTPSTLTLITHRQIEESGARSLDELLEIYVPQFAYMYKVDGNQIGIGGIISDRNNKVLLLINGRVMNIRGKDGGAVAERFISMLDDIKQIEVLGGPGSTIYGAGAIAGVISITTFDSDSFDGLAVHASAGYVEDFGSIAMKYAAKSDDDFGIFVYAGIDVNDGVDSAKLKNKFAFDYETKDIKAYERYPHETVNLNASFNQETRKKLHLQLKKGGLEFWSRYTQSSLSLPTYQHFYILYGDNYPWLRNTGSENDQWCSVLKYTQKVGNFRTTYELSYLQSEYEKINLSKPGKEREKINEDNIDAKIVTTYKYSENGDFALGVEYLRSRFKDYQKSSIAFYQNPTSWTTNRYSVFAEAKNEWLAKVMTFVDFRIDKHTYTDPLYSARAAVVYPYSRNDVLKLNYSHSLRYIDEVDLYRQYHENNEKPDVESIDRVELIYDKTVFHFSATFKTTFNNHRIVAYNNIFKGTDYIGTAKFYTLEGILRYHAAKYDFVLSHVFTSLNDFTLADERIVRQNVSASPYGYGNDFANWNKNITKVRFDYNYNEKLKFIGSLRVFWGLKGAVDMANYNKNTFPPALPSYYKLPAYEDDTSAFGVSAYLNLSLQYRYNDKATFALHGYNLLGVVDEDISKRNYFQTSSNYFVEEPAVAVSIDYKLY